MENKSKRKCGVIGVGAVGSAVSYALTMNCDGLISELVLIDVDAKRAEAEAADISHALPFSSSSHTQIYSGEYKDLYDADIIIITAGAAQKNGEESRRELTARNIPIIRDICERINDVNNDAIILIVTNPVDIMTYAAVKFTGGKRRRVFGTGCVLDTARMKHELGTLLAVDSKNIHMFICGEHGDSEFPLWSGANISGINLPDYCRFDCDKCNQRELDRVFEAVRDSAYNIIEGKGATSYGIASAVARVVSVILKGENSVLPVSVLLDGEYGISDTAISVPCVIGADGIENIIEIPLSAEEKKRLHESALTLSVVISNSELAEAKHAYKTEFIV